MNGKLGRRQRVISLALITFLILAGLFVNDKPVSSKAPTPAPVTPPKPREFISYRPKKGETLDVIREKFGVDAETIIWSNRLKGQAYFRGNEKLIIPPTSGVVYVPKKGESFRSIANSYGTTEEKLLYWNRAGFKAGTRIIIAGAHYPKHPLSKEMNKVDLPNRNLLPIKNYHLTGSGTRFPGGWCTTWVHSIGGNFPWKGDARLWPAGAKKAHWKMSKTPKVGAMYAEPWYSPYGHISLVVATSEDGSFIVSEMPTFGLNNPSYRIVPKVDKRATFIYYPK